MSNKYSGSIVGEELSNYVQEQITTRQIAHGSGWNGQRTPEQITYLNSRTAWVKLASGTYLSPEKLADMGFPPSAQEQFQGTGLAKSHILFGGYASLTEDNPKTPLNLISGTGTFDTYQRTNFLGNNGAYIEGQDFGIVPMPGIESLDVKALNRGSLKKAIVKIKVQDRNQLNILDVLYLRLGYTVLLEWGNSIFLDNKGKLQQITDTILENDQLFFNPEWNQDKAYDDILQYIENYRNIYAGNYDGLLGKVSNFNWTFNKDGSYDVELTILSYGDIIESLKTNITAKTAIYNAVDKGATSYLKGRTIEDHRTDNILFTILKFFQVLSADSKYESDKLTIDGTKKGFFVKQGDPETKFETKKITFSATYTLYRRNDDNTTAPVKSSDFNYYVPDFQIATDENGGFSYDGIQSKVKELFDKDRDAWEKINSLAKFGVTPPGNVNPIYDMNVGTPSETTQMVAGQQSTTGAGGSGQILNQAQVNKNLPLNPQPEYQDGGSMNIPFVAFGTTYSTQKTFPSPAYYMGAKNYTGIIKTDGNIVTTAAGKYVQKFPIFTWPNKYYSLQQLFNSTTDKWTYTGNATSYFPTSLGAGATPDDSIFKLKYKSLGSENNDKYMYVTTLKFYDTNVGANYFVKFEYPNTVWGILSKDGKIIYDGLQSRWSKTGKVKNTGVRFTLTHPKLFRNESPIGPDTNTNYASFPGNSVPANWPKGTYTANDATRELEKAWKTFQENSRTPDFPAPKYNANGAPIDDEFEFFHRFVANNESDAKSQGKPFYWGVSFNREQKVLNTETVENPIYTINPYDSKGFCVLDLDEGKQYYIRFGFLLQIMEDKAILKIDKNKLTAETYDENPPIVKIAYNTGSFDMLCLPNQMSFDLGKAIVRRDNILKTWSGGKNSKVFPELAAWSNEDNSEVNTKEDYNINVADIMNVYLNTDFVGQCMLSATDERGNMATYQFINNICIGLNKALTGVNNIEPVIDETTNTLYLIDSTPKYDYKKAKNKEGKYELQLYGYQAFGKDKNSDGVISPNEIETYESTFARKIDLKTAITPEYASMIAIGATAAGYAKGIEATSFAKWNLGIEDRFKRNFIPGDKTFATGATDYKQDIISSYQQIMQDIFYALGIQ